MDAFEAALAIDPTVVSDMHKTAFGIRPQTDWWQRWDAMSNMEKQEEFGRLVEAVERFEEQERLSLPSTQNETPSSTQSAAQLLSEKIEVRQFQVLDFQLDPEGEITFIAHSQIIPNRIYMVTGEYDGPDLRCEVVIIYASSIDDIAFGERPVIHHIAMPAGGTWEEAMRFVHTEEFRFWERSIGVYLQGAPSFDEFWASNLDRIRAIRG